MKKVILALSATIALANASTIKQNSADNIQDMFANGNASGYMQYYYISTGKAPKVPSEAHSLGGELDFKTASLYGVSLKAGFMTTNPFLLGPHVDTSIIGKDNGVRGEDATKGFSVLAKANIAYKRDIFEMWLGRETIKTPLINTKRVRMLDSAVEGTLASVVQKEGFNASVGYLSGFKQRTSDTFTNIVQHALGDDTETITGSANGSVVPFTLSYKSKNFAINFDNYYAQDFMNSAYLDGYYKYSIADVKYKVSAQGIYQNSTGNADKYFAQNYAYSHGKIDAKSLSAKIDVGYSESKFSFAFSNVFKKSEVHNSLVLPWDGTPLYTNMITSNDLFQSLYGHALNSDSAYIGGTQGIKLAYKQGFNFTGFSGYSATLSYANFANDKFANSQNDTNLVLAYANKKKNMTLALKGIWVNNNTSANKAGKIKQDKELAQYRVIANLKF